MFDGLAICEMAVYHDTVDAVVVELKSLGFDECVAFLKKLIAEMKAAGKTTAEIERKMQAFKTALAANPNISNTFIDNVFKAVNGAQKNSALESLAKLHLAIFKLKTTFRVPREILRFTEGMAKLNVELRMMSYNANMAVSTLMSMGGVLGTFGGSEKDVAQAGKKYELQKQRAMQGQGFGYLAENAWKYGFNFNFAETQEQRFVRMIEHMRHMSLPRRVAFAEDEGLSESQKMAALWYADHGGAEAYKAKQKGYEPYAEGQEEAAKAGFELKEATTELSLAWRQFKNYVMQALTPIVTALTKAFTALVRVLSGKVMGWITTIGILVGGLFLTVWAVIGSFKSIITAASAMSKIFKGFSFSSFLGSLKTAIISLGKAIGSIGKVIGSIGRAITTAWTFVVATLKAGVSALAAVAAKAAAILAVFVGGLLIGYGLFKALEKPITAFIEWIIGLIMKIPGLRKLLGGPQKEEKQKTNEEIADDIEKKGLSSRTVKALAEQGLSVQEIEQREKDAVKRLRSQHDLTQMQAVSMGDFTATHNMNSTTVNNSPNINVVANITGTGDTEQDGKAIADVAAKGIAQYAQSKMSGVKA